MLLPVRNGWPHIEEALRSCLEDLNTDDRLLVLDNGSTDSTVTFVGRVAAEDARVQLVLTGAAGLAEALNVGLRLADTALVARLDADDVVLSGRFSAQVAALMADPELVLCGTQIKRFVRDVDQSTSVSALPSEHEDIVSALRRGRHALSHPTVMFRREAALRIGGYWTHGVSEDCDFFLRLSRVGKLSNLPVCGLGYRFHGGSLNARRQVDILIGMRYAAATYEQPRESATPYDTFREAILSSPWERFRLRVAAASDRLYRDAQVRLLESRFSAVGGVQLAAAGLLRADKAIERMLRSLSLLVRPSRPQHHS
ncbi:glycosyltransferase family 2 protein [Blastococcus sp. SYSU D00669]